MNYMSDFLCLFFFCLVVSDVSKEDWSYELCRESSEIVEEKIYKEYRIRISETQEMNCGLLDIEKNGKVIFHDEYSGGHFFLGSDWQKKIKPIGHLIGGDHTTLLVSLWTGGAHCCFSLHIFKLDGAFKRIGVVGDGNYYPILEDLNGDGIYEVKFYDDFLAYVFSSFAYSAVANVILEYSDEGYKVAYKYMLKPTPSLQTQNKKIKSWNKNLRQKKHPNWPPPDLIQDFTNMVFSGNKKIATSLLDRAWPKNLPGKEEFLAEYESVMGYSVYAEEYKLLQKF